MPQTVEFPELGTVDFPDEMSPEDIARVVPSVRMDLVRQREQSVEQEGFETGSPVAPVGGARDFVSRLLRDINRGTLSLARGAARYGAEYLMPGDEEATAKERAEEQLDIQELTEPVSDFSKEWTRRTQAIAPINPELSTPVREVASQAIASGLHVLGPSKFFPAAGIGTYGLMQSQDEYEAAKEAGATEEQAKLQGLAGGVIGAGSELALGGIARLIPGIRAMSPGGRTMLSQWAERNPGLATTLSTIIRETAQEPTEGFLLDTAAKLTYDAQGRDPFNLERRGIEAIGGAIGGGFFGIPGGISARQERNRELLGLVEAPERIPDQLRDFLARTPEPLVQPGVGVITQPRYGPEETAEVMGRFGGGFQRAPVDVPRGTFPFGTAERQRQIWMREQAGEVPPEVSIPTEQPRRRAIAGLLPPIPGDPNATTPRQVGPGVPPQRPEDDQGGQTPPPSPGGSIPGQAGQVAPSPQAVLTPKELDELGALEAIDELGGLSDKDAARLADLRKRRDAAPIQANRRRRGIAPPGPGPTLPGPQRPPAAVPGEEPPAPGAPEPDTLAAGTGPVTGGAPTVATTPQGVGNQPQGKAIDGYKLMDQLGVDPGLVLRISAKEREGGILNTPLPFANVSTLVGYERYLAGWRDPAKLEAPITVGELGKTLVRSSSQFGFPPGHSRSFWLVKNKKTGNYEALPVWKNVKGVVMTRIAPANIKGTNFDEFLKTYQNDFDLTAPSYRVILKSAKPFIRQTYTPAQVEAMYKAAQGTAQPVAPPAQGEKLETEPLEETEPTPPEEETGPEVPSRPAYRSRAYATMRGLLEGGGGVILPSLTEAAALIYDYTPLLRQRQPITVQQAIEALVNALKSNVQTVRGTRRDAAKILLRQADRLLNSTGLYERYPDVNHRELQLKAVADAIVGASKSVSRSRDRFAAGVARGLADVVKPGTAQPGAATGTVPRAAARSETAIAERTISLKADQLRSVVDGAESDKSIDAETARSLRINIDTAVEGRSLSELAEVQEKLSQILQSKLPPALQTTLNFPRLHWTQNRKGEYEAVATAEFLDWWKENKGKDNPLGIRAERKGARLLVIAKEIPGSETKVALAVGQVRRPLTIKQVQDAVKRIIGVVELPSTIWVIDQPGVGWRGKVVFHEDEPQITLNAADLGSEAEVADTLYEEGLHIAFKDGSIQSLWAEVLKNVDQFAINSMMERGYDENVALEEAANELIRQLNATAESRTAWERFVDGAMRFLRRLFGIRPQQIDPETAQKLVAKALLHAKGVLVPVRGDESQRFSIPISNKEYSETWKRWEEYAAYIGKSIWPERDPDTQIRGGKSVIEALAKNDPLGDKALDYLQQTGALKATESLNFKNVVKGLASTLREANFGSRYSLTSTIPYGFWIAPTGKMIAVASQAGHLTEAQKILGHGEGDTYQRMYNKGFVRAVFDRAARELSLETLRNAAPLSAQQRRAVKDYAIEHNINAIYSAPGLPRDFVHEEDLEQETRYSLTPADKPRLIKNFVEAVKQSSQRTTYGRREEVAPERSQVLIWSNAQGNWVLARADRFIKTADPEQSPEVLALKAEYADPNTQPARKQQIRYEYDRILSDFRNTPERGYVPRGATVTLDANDIMVPSRTRAEAQKIAEYLQPPPLYGASFEQRPMVGFLARLSPNHELFKQLGIKHEDLLAKSDTGAVIDKFIDYVNAEFGPETRYSLTEGAQVQLKGANVGRVARMLGDKLYSQNIGQTTGKESFQNAVDAVMAQSYAEGTDPEIVMNSLGDKFVIVDNGTGMSVDTMLTKFLPAFVSGKTVGAGGGFGMAKLAFLGSNKSFKVISITRLPDGRYMGTTLIGTGPGYLDFVENPPTITLTPDKIIKLNEDLWIKYRYLDDAPSSTGTAMAFEIKSGAHNAEYFVRKAARYVPKLSLKAFYSDAMNADMATEDVDHGYASPLESFGITKNAYIHETKKPESADALSLITSFDTPAAVIDIIAPNGAKLKSARWWGIPVLNRGILQFDHQLQFDEKVSFPDGIAINIKPKVPAESSIYPFTTSREDVTADVKSAMDGYFRQAGLAARNKVLDRYRNALQSAPAFPEIDGQTYRFLDAGGAIPSELTDSIIKDPWTARVLKHVADIQTAILAMLPIRYPGVGFGIASFAGILTGGRAYGVHFKPKGSDTSQIYHDPFLTWRDAVDETETFIKENKLTVDVAQARRLQWQRFLSKIAGVSLHEALHQIESSEGESLARELTFKAGDLIEPLINLVSQTLDEKELSQNIKSLEYYGEKLNEHRSDETAGEFISAQGGYDGYAFADERGVATGTAPTPRETRTEGPIVIPGPETRYSLSKPNQLIFSRLDQLNRMVETPGLEPEQVETIRAAGRSQAGLVPQTTIAKIETWKESRNKAEKIAGNALMPLKRYYELAGVSPEAWQSVLFNLPPGESVSQQHTSNQAVASNAVLYTNEFFRRHLDKLTRHKDAALTQLNVHAARIPEAQLRDLEAGFAGALADQLLEGMEEHIHNLQQLGSTTLNAQQREAIVRMAQELNGARVNYRTALGVAFLNIATAIPADILRGDAAVSSSGAMVPNGTPGALNGAKGIAAWIKAQQSLGKPIASDPLVSWLTNPGSDGYTPLEHYRELQQRLLQLQTILADRDTAAKAVKSFKNWFYANSPKSKATRVTLRQFAQRYAAWRQQNKYAADIARAIRRDWQRWDDRFRGLEMAEKELTQMMQSPDYNDKVRDAVNVLSASEANTSELSDTGKSYFAKGPLAGEPASVRYLDYTPSEQAARTNTVNSVYIAGKIGQWLNSQAAQSNPVAAAAWRKELEWLEWFGMRNASDQANYGNVGLLRPFGWTADFMINLGFSGPKQGFKRRLGGVSLVDYGDALNAWGVVSSGLDDIYRHEVYGWFKVQELVIKAANEHGYEGQEIPNEWIPEVLNKILARNQSAGGVLLRAGDRLPNGLIITDADMAAAQLMKRNTDAVRELVSSNKQFAEMIRNPLRIYDPELELYRMVAAVDYLLEVPRTLSSQGMDFAALWDNARAAEVTPEGATEPGIEERVALLNEHIDVVNDYWTTTNPQFTQSVAFKGDELTRKLHAERVAEQKADKAQDMNFQTVEDYATWLGHEKAAELGTDPTIEVSKAMADLVASFDAYTTAVKDEIRREKIENEASTVTIISNVGKGPLTTPRGAMLAPDYFYDYTTATKPNYGNLRGKALLPFIARVYHELDFMVDALEKEVKQRDRRQADIEKTGKSPFRARRMMRREERRAGRVGKESVTPTRELRTTLKMAQNELARLEVNLVKTAKELYDSVSIDIARRTESSMTLPLLAAESPTINNAISALSGSAFLDTMAGDTSWWYRFPWELGVLGTRVMKGLTLAVANSKPLSKHLSKYNRLYSGLNRVLLKWLQQEAEMAEILNRAGVGTRLNVREHIRAIKRNPATYGELDQRRIGWTQRQANEVLSALSGLVLPKNLPLVGDTVIPGLEGLKSWSQLVDNYTLRQIARNIVRRLDKVKLSLLRAMEERASGAVAVQNWNDKSQPLTAFTPQELGASSHRELEFLRQTLLPAGTLEAIALDYWNRTQHMTDDRQKLAEPLFKDQASENSVVREFFRRSGNPVDEANRPTRVTTGNIGLLWQMLMRFSTWPMNYASTINSLFERDLRDMPIKDIQYFTKLFALMLIVMLVAIFGHEGKALLRGLISGDEPSTPRLAGVEGAGDFAKLAAVSMAEAMLPYYGELISRMTGSSANRPLVDLTGMVPMAGIVARAVDTGVKIGQSEDPVFPLLDFVRTSMPITRPALHAAEVAGIETITGASLSGEAAARQASRAVRSAAPSELEKTSGGGGVGGRLTPMTGIMRRALSAAYSGDEEAAREAIEDAVAYQMEQGKSEEEARRAVLQSVQARTPGRRVLGKLPTTEEEERIIGRMTGSQAESYARSREAFDLLSGIVGKEIPFTARAEQRPGGGGLFARRRSVLGRGRGRRSSLFRRRSRRVGLGRRRGFGSRRRRSLFA